MPQICKCRIVNFRYNGGKRLIADELFDFGNELGSGANSVLIDMANGIGKTVMVQLMLQPVIPNAKVSGREIESYFQRPEDHCFVLLEWILDNSKDKLVTGIAMAAGDEIINTSLDNESEAKKGRRVRYYTFYTKESGSSEYDIAHLPLSRKENGAFVPASFNEIRDLGKRTRNHITVYSSDSGRDWSKKLEEFGILQLEWQTVMEKLNVKEGGISDFFEDFKNSDDLINKLLIPTIERRLKANNTSNEDNSLETMILNHADKFGKQKGNIAERDYYLEARNILNDLKNKADNTANTNYAFIECNRNIWGFFQALTRYRDELLNEKSELKTKFANALEEERNIRWERVSAEYYEVKKQLDEAQKSYDSATENVQRAREDVCLSKKEFAKLECAELLGKKHYAEDKIKAFNDLINEKEGDEKTKNDIRNLQYSIAKNLEILIPAKKEELNRCENDFESNEKKLVEANSNEASFLKEQKATQSKYDSINGKLAQLQKSNDQLVEELEIRTYRMLGGIFNEVDLINAQKQKSSEKENNEKAIDKAKSDAELLETRISEITKDIEENNGELRVKKFKIEDLQKKIDDFASVENKIKNIFDKYSSDYLKRASGALNNYIESKIKKAESEKNKIVRKLENSIEKLDAVQKGSLHIPTMAIKFLEKHGYEYDTCEKYLLNQKINNIITQEKCDAILADNCFVAYSLLMDEEQKNNLFSAELDYWLPFGVPVLTVTELEKLLNGERLNSNILALYSKEYFKNPSEFTIKLEQEISDLNEELRIKKSDINILNTDLREITDFAVQENENKKRLEDKTALNHEKILIEDNINKLEKESQQCKKQQSEIKEKINNLSDSIKNAESWLKTFAKLYDDLEDEKKFIDEINRLNDQLRDIAAKLVSVKKILNYCENRKQELKILQDSLKPEIQKMENAFGDVKNAAEGDIVDGEWNNLYQQLKTKLNSLDASIKYLRDSIEEQNKTIEDCNRRLDEKHKDYKISLEDYNEIKYSDEKRQQTKKLVDRKEEELSCCQNFLTDENGKKGKCEAAFDNARARLRDFGDKPLDRCRIGSDFENRLKAKANEKSKIRSEQEINDKQCSETDNIWYFADSFLNGKPKPDKISESNISNIDISNEFKKLSKNFESSFKQLDETQNELLHSIKIEGSRIKEKISSLGDSICKLADLINSNSDGDRFYTISERLDNNISNVDKSINRIKSDLEDFERSKEDLVRQCVLQAKRVRDGLNDIVNASKIKLIDNSYKHILKIDLPEIDEIISKGYIADEITKATEELATGITNGENLAKLRIQARNKVSSCNLLRKFLHESNIPLEAYKIDVNPKNSSYRNWKDTQIQNSGAEKFLAYFAIIVSIINYNRSKAGSFNKDQRSVLILDNPFGPISSAHVLQPMFDMAERLKVQLICFSNITKADITSRFKVVIKAVVKQMAASNTELLTHDGNELIEHGYYKRELF